MAHDETNRTLRRTFLQTVRSQLRRPWELPAALLRRTPPRSRWNCPGAPWARRGSTSRSWTRGPARAPTWTGSCGTGLRAGSGPTTPRRPTTPRGRSRSGSRRTPRSASRSSSSPRTRPRSPAQIMGMLDKRLAALGTDYVDLFFIHSFGDNHTLDDAIAMVKSKELKEASEAAKKSGKARLVGISTHHKDRAAVDPGGGRGRDRRRDHAPVPPLARQGLAAQQGDRRRLQARDRPDLDEADRRQLPGRQDRRGTSSTTSCAACRCSPRRSSRRTRACCTRSGPTSASSAVCTTMRNTDHIRENTDAAAPVRAAQSRPTSTSFATRPSPTGPMLCADCDGRCFDRRGDPGRAGQPHAVPDVPRAPRRPRRGPPALRRACPPRPATGRAPTWKPPAPPAPTGSTSRGSCPRWTGTWPEKSDVFLIVPRDIASRTHSPRPDPALGNTIVHPADVATRLASIRGSQSWPRPDSRPKSGATSAA